MVGCDSSAFTSSMLDEVRRSQSAERFIISNVAVKTTHGSIYLDPVTFFLKPE